MMQLILASTSPYRKSLLERLQLPFTCKAPGVEEQPLAGEAPAALAARLALAKARAVARHHPDALVIGSDQVAALGDTILGKPLTHERATAQLQACSGRTVEFHTGLALLGRDREAVHVEPFQVSFRTLAPDEIDTYLRLDSPYDCAGSFKWESLGITLFEHLRGDDPTSLEGLPLIALTRLLAGAGYPVLSRNRPGSSAS